jgi:hypothetical protein
MNVRTVALCTTKTPAKASRIRGGIRLEVATPGLGIVIEMNTKEAAHLAAQIVALACLPDVGQGR